MRNVFRAAAAMMLSNPWEAPKVRSPRLRVARGRGNQGDWLSPFRQAYPVSKEHQEWNAQIEAKKRQRHLDRIERDRLGFRTLTEMREAFPQ